MPSPGSRLSAPPLYGWCMIMIHGPEISRSSAVKIELREGQEADQGLKEMGFILYIHHSPSQSATIDPQSSCQARPHTLSLMEHIYRNSKIISILRRHFGQQRNCLLHIIRKTSRHDRI